MYVDQDGRIVSTELGLIHVDDGGRIWSVNHETGQAYATERFYGRAYESTDCTGPALTMYPPLPREVFTVPGDDGGVRVRPDDVVATARVFGSYTWAPPDGGTRCQQYPSANVQFLAVPLPPLQPITTPVLPFRGPLHIERR